MTKWVLLSWLAVGMCRAAAPAGPAAEFFETKIRPVLAKNCYACHTASAMGGLRLDSREHLLKGGKDGAVVIPGNPEGSLLIQAVRQTHARLKMPPQGKLNDTEIASLEAWIKAGVIWPEAAAPVSPAQAGYVITPEQRAFWSFQPVAQPSIPQVRNASWVKSPIDAFILAKLEHEGLEPVQAADKRALLRRATFDLIGLPPTPGEMDDFLSDTSPGAFAKVVDRLLASAHYGERWGRYWLDLARYADGQLGASKDTPFPNAFRYRDWVVQAFNRDMPYDLFVKAQIAADQLETPEHDKLMPGLGFYALGPGDDDRVDVTGKVFLGLTLGCAQCHDHKYDPIPTKDFYSLLGVFKSTENYDLPLAPKEVVERYDNLKKQIEAQKDELNGFIERQGTELGRMLAEKTSRYLMASWEVMSGARLDDCAVAKEENLDDQILERWIRYLRDPKKDHTFLKPYDELLARHAPREEVQRFADKFQAFVSSIFADKRGMDDRNYVALGGAAGAKDERKRQYTNLESLPIEKYYLWRDLASEPYKKDFLDFKGGVYYYGPKQIDRFLAAEWRDHLASLRQELARLEKALPPQYPFLHTIRDGKKPANLHVYIRGDANNLGEEAPRRFLQILSKGEPAPFQKGSGRLELAEAIASPSNPLFARVMVNRIWQLHFGQGIVRTPDNFGQLGERPTHPELLDYLARYFTDHHWSIKAMHRAIMLSAVYQLSTDYSEPNFQKDPGNRYLWRANLRQRLDAEALRDALLSVSGRIDLEVGGPPKPLDDSNSRRTLYGMVGRTTLDPMLALFDFPNPNNTSEQRMATVGPMQRLYFMNSSFVALQAKALAERLEREQPADSDRITRAYRLLFGRKPNSEEIRMGLDFLQQGGGWPAYAQVLLSSSEFSSVN